MTKQNAPYRVVFMGTPDFAVPALRALHQASSVAKIVAVYTQPDRPAGRGQKLQEPIIKQVAKELDLPVFQPESINTPEEKRRLSDFLPDVVVVVAFAQFLSKGVLSIPRLGCVNIHSSLLPKYRGAAPIQYALLNGEKETGVTTMKLVSKMDAGPILLQATTPILPTMNARALHDVLATMGGSLIVETLQRMLSGDLKEVEQDESQVTYAKLIAKSDGELIPERSVKDCLNRARAFDPWPGTFLKTNIGTLKIHEMRSFEGVMHGMRPGDFNTRFGNVLFCVEDGVLEFLNIQPEGKRKMSAVDFLNGLKNVELTYAGSHEVPTE